LTSNSSFFHSQIDPNKELRKKVSLVHLRDVFCNGIDLEKNCLFMRKTYFHIKYPGMLVLLSSVQTNQILELKSYFVTKLQHLPFWSREICENGPN